eukprot:gene5232-6675_t
MELSPSALSQESAQCRCSWPRLPSTNPLAQGIEKQLMQILADNHTACMALAGALATAPNHAPTLPKNNAHTLIPTNTYVPRIIDTFLFFDELSMLRLRYEMTRDVVDLYVLIEAKQTFTGKPKPLHFREGNHILPSGLLNRTIAVAIDLPFNPSVGNGSAWDNEAYQRDAFLKVLTEHVKPDPRDIILHSDLDEIFRSSTLMAAARTLSLGPPASKMWMQPFAVRYDVLMRSLADRGSGTGLINHLRVERTIYIFRNLFSRGGWHLSYFKSLPKIFEKLDAFSHSEVNTEVVRREAAKRIHSGLSAVHHDKDQLLFC